MKKILLSLTAISLLTSNSAAQDVPPPPSQPTPSGPANLSQGDNGWAPALK